MRHEGPMDCQQLDVNSATAEDLESWLGLDERSAMMVVTARENLGGQFASLDDLRDLPEVGPDLLAQNRHVLCCTARPSERGAQRPANGNADRRVPTWLESLAAASTSGGSRPQHLTLEPTDACVVVRVHHHQQQNGDRPFCCTTCIGDSGTRACSASYMEPGCGCRRCCCCCRQVDGGAVEENVHAKVRPNATGDATRDHPHGTAPKNREPDSVADTPGTKRKSEDSAADGESAAGGKRLCCSSASPAGARHGGAGASTVGQPAIRSGGSAVQSPPPSDRCATPPCGGAVEQRRCSPHPHVQCVDRGASVVDDHARTAPVDGDSRPGAAHHLPGVGGDVSGPAACPATSGCGFFSAAAAACSAVGGSRSRRLSCRSRPPPVELESWIKTFQTWDSTEKLRALDDLIAVCDSAHVRHMMSVIEPQFQRDFISLLPKELALHVLSFLDARDLMRAAQTCRTWRILSEDGLLWRERCREEAMDSALPLYARARASAGADGEAMQVQWKAVYMNQLHVEHNWQRGTVRLPKVLRGHDDHVITCLEFCGDRIVSGSDDNTLKVWSVETGRCLRNLVGHTGGVWSSQMKDHIVVSGSTDRTLKVWDTETGQCVHTLHGHTSTVRCLHLHGDVVVSGSRDATLRMWNIRSGECVHVLTGHVAAVRCVQYDGVRVVSGAYDYTVRVWDPATESCMHVLQGHTNRVYSLQFDGVHIVSGSLDTSIRVWDAETGACKHTLIGHQSLTSGMELKDNILVSGNADSTVKVWDIITGQCLQTLQGPNKHQSAVTCLQFNRKFVITSSDDGTVKLWSLKTGDFIRNLVTLESGGSGGVVWRVKADHSRLVCAAGSRNGTEETKLLVLDFGLPSLPATAASAAALGSAAAASSSSRPAAHEIGAVLRASVGAAAFGPSVWILPPE